MIKWGIIGLGNMGQKFANAIKETSNSKIISVASLDKNKIKKHELMIKFKKVWLLWSLWGILSIKKSKMVMSFTFMLITEEI